MAADFEKAWQLLHRLQGEIVLTPDKKQPNKIVSFSPKGMKRMILLGDSDKKHPRAGDWIDGSLVPKREFKKWWDRLVVDGVVVRRPGMRPYPWGIAAACLAAVPDLGVTIEKSSPLTLKLECPK